MNGACQRELEACLFLIMIFVLSPKSLHEEASGDTGTISWLYRCVHGLTAMLCSQSRATSVLLCNGMKIIDLRSDWLALNRDS